MKIRLPENKSQDNPKVRRIIFDEIKSFLDLGISLSELESEGTEINKDCLLYLFRDYKDRAPEGWEINNIDLKKYVYSECRKMDNKEKIKEILK